MKTCLLEQITPVYLERLLYSRGNYGRLYPHKMVVEVSVSSYINVPTKKRCHLTVSWFIYSKVWWIFETYLLQCLSFSLQKNAVCKHLFNLFRYSLTSFFAVFSLQLVHYAPFHQIALISSDKIFKFSVPVEPFCRRK